MAYLIISFFITNIVVQYSAADTLGGIVLHSCNLSDVTIEVIVAYSNACY